MAANASSISRSRAAKSSADSHAVVVSGSVVVGAHGGTLFDPVVRTNLPDYAPDSTAYISADNFYVGGTVVFQVVEVADFGADGTLGTADDVLANGDAPGDDVWYVTDGVQTIDAGADGELGSHDDTVSGDLDGVVDGAIETSWYVDPYYGNRAMQLIATGVDAGEDRVFGTADDLLTGQFAIAGFTDSV